MDWISSPFGVGVFAVLILTWLIAVIVYYVRAFEESTWLGLLIFFFPPAGLYFLIRHWRRALGPWCVAVVSGGVAALLAVSLVNNNGIGSNGRGGTKGLGVKGELAHARMQMMNVEESIARQQAEIQTEYERLIEQRAALDEKDSAVVEAFNAATRRYEANRAELAQEREKLVAMQVRVERLMKEEAELAPTVVMYTTSRCPACRMAKQWCQDNGVPYQERDIERSRQAYNEYQARGAGGVPLIVINGKVSRGFNRFWMQEQLGR